MHEPLRNLLAHLKDAISSDDDTENQEELEALAGKVERRIGEEDDEGVVDELRDHVQHFEVSHPSLAASINQAADALSAMGL